MSLVSINVINWLAGISIKCRFSSQAKSAQLKCHAHKHSGYIYEGEANACSSCSCSCRVVFLLFLWRCRDAEMPHDATKCNTQNKTENRMRNILKNLTRMFSNSSWVLCSWWSSSLMDTLLSGWRWAKSRA